MNVLTRKGNGVREVVRKEENITNCLYFGVLDTSAYGKNLSQGHAQWPTADRAIQDGHPLPHCNPTLSAVLSSVVRGQAGMGGHCSGTEDLHHLPVLCPGQTCTTAEPSRDA